MKTLIICGVICLLLGFFVGRYTMKEGERTTYMKGETIRDTINVLYSGHGSPVRRSTL